MATVNPPDIGRTKKYYGRNGEIIHDLDNNMAEHSTAPQVYGVHTSQAPKSFEIPIAEADGPSRDVSKRPIVDIYKQRQAKLKTIIEMFPSGSICKIHLPDIDAYRTVIHRIEFSTTHLDPALHIEFFKLEDILAMPDETSPDTLSQYPCIQMCTIYDPRQIESIDSSEAAEMSREFIKNEILDIKKEIVELKDNLRRLSRLRNSGDSTSRLFSRIDMKYYALIRSLERKSFTKRPFMGPSLPY